MTTAAATKTTLALGLLAATVLAALAALSGPAAGAPAASDRETGTVKPAAGQVLATAGDKKVEVVKA
ncbi:hypothetical protein [Streptomyces laurentii]|uniref:hypothetical protein n=1 Tax=Streptomyces laurentii TaxID=39478 RepID=UPI00368DBEF9